MIANRDRNPGHQRGLQASANNLRAMALLVAVVVCYADLVLSLGLTLR